MQVRNAAALTLLFASFLIALGCSDTTGGDETGTPTLLFLTSAPLPDTVSAADTVLVVVLNGNGTPARRQSIIFESTPALLLSELDGGTYQPLADSTGPDGRAEILAVRGTFPGTAWLRVRLPDLNLLDSVRFEILPGNPAGLRVTPADTALRLGGQLTINGTVVDRYGNPVLAGVGFAAESSAIAVTSDLPNNVTALAYGRASIIASGAGQTHRSWVSVVPVGTLAYNLQAPTTGDSTGIGLSSTDGSVHRMLFAAPFDYASDRPLDWAPDGQSLVFHLGTNSAPHRLYRIDLLGAIQPVMAQRIGAGLPELLPRYGPDGRIYFTLETDWTNGTDELWRVNADGSSPQRIGPAAAPYQSDTYVAPAPDGEHVWFSTDRPGPGTVDPTALAVLHVDSVTVNYFDFYGIGAVWSPAGDRVAFIDQNGAIVVTNPDGSGRRTVGSPSQRYVPYMDWSPNGKWIVASWRPAGSAIGGVDIIEPDLGLILPLPFAAKWRHPAWRP